MIVKLVLNFSLSSIKKVFKVLNLTRLKLQEPSYSDAKSLGELNEYKIHLIKSTIMQK